MAKKTGKTETVLELGDGRTWLRLLDKRAAEEEGSMAEHAVGFFFDRADTVGNAFYSLRSPEGRPLATAMLPADPSGGIRKSAARHWSDPQVVGPRNGDPFPEQGDAIAALGTHLGMELEPDLYAYRSSRAADPEDDGPRDGAPGVGL